MNKYLLLIILALIIISCKKERGQYNCPGNCKSYVIKGRVYDATTNKAFSNYPVKLRWKTFRGNCIFCPMTQKDVYNGKTDQNGNFTINANLDTTLFQDYSLILSTPGKESYLNVSSGYLNNENLEGQPIDVPYYPEASLTIQLKRTQKDTFTSVMVSHYWYRLEGRKVSVWQQSFFDLMFGGKDTTIHVSTVADIQTTVRVSKSYNGNSKDIKDSIVCKRGSDNVLRMEY